MSRTNRTFEILTLLLFSIFFPSVRAGDDSSVYLETIQGSDSTLLLQLDQFKSRISILESEIAVKNALLESKDGDLAEFQKIVQAKSRAIESLRKQIKSIQEELMKAKLESTSKKQKMYGASLPMLLVSYFDYCLKYTKIEWKSHGKPALEFLRHKVLASELLTKACKHSVAHMDTLKDEWLPAIKGHWRTFSTVINPHIQVACLKTIEFYKLSLTSIKPYAIRLQEQSIPFFQDARKLSKPYIELLFAVTTPHIEGVQIVLKPYKKKVIQTYGKFLKFVTAYHHQVQIVAHEELKNYQLTEPFATKEIVWFLASAFLAFPIYLLFLLVASCFCNSRKTKPHRSRRNKRRH
ncbi:hypothetical protein ZOSMA_11G00420 [Zostera marina]|uniref:Uncharacterized protein n=1 Tax=Zostera marina TaxID=29655 RepID=A0A0K9Q139_ZOSMR|nr:hypothetical protein ZOSMA_11G00420 [Zostera marina]